MSQNKALKLVSRTLLWLKVLKSFKPLTLKSALSLILSAPVDLIRLLSMGPSNPQLAASGLYRLKPSGLTVFVRGGTEDFYYLTPLREGPIDRFIRTSLRRGDVFVDVGANVGYYTLLAAQKGAYIVSVEPLPHNVAMLILNLRLNQLEHRVRVVNKCAWHERAIIPIVVPRGFYGLATIFAHPNTGTVLRVECDRLDNILEEQDRIRLVKIDIEGAEYEALEGMMKTLGKVEYLVIEVSRRPRDVINLLRKSGFNIRRFGTTKYILARRRR